MNTLQRKVALRLVVVLGLMGSAIGQTGGGFEQVIIRPGDLKWVDMPTGQGQRRAVLLGDPTKPGPYTIRMKFPANAAIPPHTHPDDRQVTVISGMLYLGQGDKLDCDKAVKVLPATFFTEPRKSAHYGCTGPEEVITQVSGMGPTSTDYLK